MAVTDFHICIFCQGKMTNFGQGEHWCSKCLVDKINMRYIFTRKYKDYTYRFTYDLWDNEIIISKGKSDYSEQITVWRVPDLFFVTPQNWKKKLKTILVFS